jgi:pimeloyl-ACP methyl ester carboxylesterase
VQSLEQKSVGEMIEMPERSVFLNSETGKKTSFRTNLLESDKNRKLSLIFLHGFNGSSKSWHFQFNHFRRYGFLAIDAPGFGISDPVNGGMTAIADEVAALIAHLGISKAVVVGHSMGGMLAQVLVAKYPHISIGAVLSCTHKGHGRPIESPLSAEIEKRLAERESLDNSAYGRLRVRNMLDGAVVPEVFEFLAMVAGEIRPEGIRCGGRAMQILDTTALLPRLAIPVMILSADRDIVVKPDALAALQADLPQAMIVRLTGVGHAPYCEDAAAFNAAIDRFLTTHDLSCEWRPA